tara:strand:+ start:267 stop:464 length:198 start_codon:yes stop_codon:yes gene_type:complete
MFDDDIRIIQAEERLQNSQHELDMYMALDSRRGLKYRELVRVAELAEVRLRAVHGNIYQKNLETV